MLDRKYQRASVFLALLLNGLVVSCSAPVYRSTLPEGYQGVVAQQPVVQKGDYWVYERGDFTKVKSTGIPRDLSFPLWVGKTWNYETGARRRGQPSTSTLSPNPARIDCYVTAFAELTVPAGSFQAFRCECQCQLLAGEGFYQQGCGEWTIWYAPEVKNIVKTLTYSSSTSMQLLAFRISQVDPGSKPIKKLPVIDKRGV